MVDRLSRGPATVKQLAEPLTMSLPAVLQHLRVLEDERPGPLARRSAGSAPAASQPAALQAAEQWIADRPGRMGRADLDRLERFLREEDQ